MKTKLIVVNIENIHDQHIKCSDFLILLLYDLVMNVLRSAMIVESRVNNYNSCTTVHSLMNRG